MILTLRAGVVNVRQPPGLRCPQRQVLAVLAILIVGAWVTLGLTSSGMAMAAHSRLAGMSSMAGMSGMSGMSGMPGMGSDSMATHGSSMGSAEMWALMIVAMMLPSALPAAAYAGAQSLRWRRRRAVMQFVGGYTAVWVAAGALILAATAGLQGSAAALWIAVGVAAVWQLMPSKRRALLDCHRPVPLPPYGAAAPRAAMGFGLRNGWACVRSCWAMMVVMSLVAGLELEWMAAITVLVVTEKLALRPRRASRRVGAVLGAAAAVAGVVALV